MRKVLQSLAILLSMIGISFAGVQPASAAPAVVTSCYSGFGTAEWNHNAQYPYGSNIAHPGGAPAWCISNHYNNDRLVWQTDGNLVAYAGEHVGTQVLWASNTYNRGTLLLFQKSDGNVVIYQGSTPIWAAGAWGTCSNAGWSLSLNYRSIEDWQVAACIFQHDGQKIIGSWAR